MIRPLLLTLIASLVVCAPAAAAPTGTASPATQFLRFIFGADEVGTEKVCWEHDDLWMLRGAMNAKGLKEIAGLNLKPGRNELMWETVQGALCIIDVREGKVDPGLNLDQVYFLHRKLALQFVYAALEQDKATLERLVTNVAKVKFGRTKAAAGGDMDVYGDLIAILPVARISKAQADKVTNSVTYRLPLGAKGLTLRLIKKGSLWLIDSDSGIDVPLAFFFK